MSSEGRVEDDGVLGADPIVTEKGTSHFSAGVEVATADGWMDFVLFSIPQADSVFLCRVAKTGHDLGSRYVTRCPATIPRLRETLREMLDESREERGLRERDARHGDAPSPKAWYEHSVMRDAVMTRPRGTQR